MMMHLLLHALSMMIVLNTLGCRENAAPATEPALPTATMQIGHQNFTLEIADTQPTRETGLMHRQSMPKNHGMLFVFDDEQVLGFYMKNTHIPLDIIFLDARGKVVAIRQMQPLDLRTVSSVRPAQYAIELNQGAAAEAGVKEGDVLTLPQQITARR